MGIWLVLTYLNQLEHIFLSQGAYDDDSIAVVFYDTIYKRRHRGNEMLYRRLDLNPALHK